MTSRASLRATRPARPGFCSGSAIEYAIDAHWSVKAEFDYADFGNRDFAMNGERNYVARIRNDQDLVKVGGNYRF